MKIIDTLIKSGRNIKTKIVISHMYKEIDTIDAPTIII
jgi:hypothetical protein